MYKVLLVDDEPIARTGLRMAFEWEANGFELVGEASNGQKAMQWIERNEVDIVITDIAMPVMDGLELMRAARVYCPSIKVVLLSCHNDFEYVREGIRLGASDYLLKPTLEAADLKTVLDKLKEQIGQEREKAEQYLRQELSSKRLEMEKSLVKLLVCEEPPEMLREDFAWLEEGYRAAVCLLDGTGKLRSEAGGVFIDMLLDEVQDSLYDHMEHGIACRVGTDQMLLIVPDRNGEAGQTERRWRSLHAAMTAGGYSFTMGVSNRVAGVRELKRAYREGEETAKLRFYQGPGCVRFHTKRCTAERFGEERENAVAGLKDTIAEGLRDQAAGEMERLLRYWDHGHRTPEEVMREALELLSVLLGRQNRFVSVEQAEAVRTMETVEELRAMLWNAFAEGWKSADEMEEEYGFHRKIIEKAIDFMKQNYTRSISLQDVADHVAVSRNYFSEMFKRVTGQNFIDFLIHLRLKRSSALLRTTTLKVYEVAEMSGFNDVKYFSRLFKKMMKVSPAEFRSSRRYG